MPKRHDKKKECQKKREKMHTQRRYATCPQDRSRKREKKKNIYSPCPRKNTRREIDHAKGSILSSTKNIHTLAPLDLIV